MKIVGKQVILSLYLITRSLVNLEMFKKQSWFFVFALFFFLIRLVRALFPKVCFMEHYPVRYSEEKVSWSYSTLRFSILYSFSDIYKMY